MTFSTALAQTTSKEFNDRYQLLVSKLGPSGVGVETLINRWEAAYPDDIEMLVAKFSFYFSKSQSSSVVVKDQDKYLGEKPVFSLKDSTGKAVNYFTENFYDDELFGQAQKALEKAIQLAPDRLDFRFMKTAAYVGSEKESPDMALSDLRSLIIYNETQHPSWVYAADGKVDEEFFVAAVQEYCYVFFKYATPGSYEAFRGSTLTADNATAKITLSATVYDTSYKHKLILKDGDTTVLTLTGLSLSNGSNTITLTAAQRSSILADMAAKKSFTGTFELSTFSGSSQIGSASTKTATVQTTAANSAPTFSGFTYKDTNATAAGVTGNNQILIQSVSTLQVTASAATAKNGATISSYSVSAGGSTASNTTVTLNVGKIYTSGTVPIIVTAIDSRGYTSSATVNITVIAYESIDITTAIMRRVNEVEDVTQVTLEGDITPVKVNNVNKNTLRKLYYQYKRTDASAYSSLTDITSFATFTDSGFTFTSDEWLSLDANYSWYVRFCVYDNLTGDTATITVSQGTPLISFRRKKVGINKREPTQALDVDGNIAANGVIVLGYAGHVEGDFNNYKNGGIFFAPTTSGISNAPPGGAGYLEVLSATDGFNLIQRYTATAAGCKVYIRSFILNTNWTPWTEK